MGSQRISENTDGIPQNIGKHKWDSREYRKTQMGARRIPENTPPSGILDEHICFSCVLRHTICIWHARSQTIKLRFSRTISCSCLILCLILILFSVRACVRVFFRFGDGINEESATKMIYEYFGFLLLASPSRQTKKGTSHSLTKKVTYPAQS